MTARENMLRAIRFERPDYIPVCFAINESVAGKDRMRWDLVPKNAEEVDRNHTYYDAFGVEWKGAIDGIRGVIQKHPLEDFSKIPDYKFPALPEFNLEADRAWVEKAKADGHFTAAGLEHGHTFLRLTDLCGYENVLLGLADVDENLMLLIERLEEYNYAFASHYAKVGYDMICFPEDLGMQNGPLISPELFLRYIKPSYERLMEPARNSGAIIHMHSDGDIRALADHLFDSGVDVLNLQDLVNGIDWIRERFFGKYAIELDIDRQRVTVFGTPADVDALIREEVEKLSSPSGGLMLVYGWYAGTPLENVKALMDALEKYMYYWA
jgi:uroporphyrinogen decarboxylase